MLRTVSYIARDVYSKLGSGHSESIYHQAMLVGLRKENLVYESERIIPIIYEGIVIGNHRSDITLPKEKFIIELKAITRKIGKSEVTQLMNYLTSLGWNQGLLINFPQPTASEYSRNNVDIISVENHHDTPLTRDLTGDKTII